MSYARAATFWVSCRLFTVFVRVLRASEAHEWIVFETAPITRRFIGQPFVRLTHWAYTKGGLLYQQINVDPR